MTDARNDMRVVMLGDSLAAGMGLHGPAFGKLAAEELGADAYLDLSAPSRTTADLLEMSGEIAAFNPTVAFVCCGGTESLVHPGAGIQGVIERFAPASWHGVAGLHPRPYYSDERRRRWRQRASSTCKVVLKRALIRLTNATPRVAADEFGAALQDLLRFFDAIGCPAYVLAMCHIDERLFPKCEASLTGANVEIERAVSQSALARVVSVRDEMRYWDDFLPDTAHWSPSGHARVAAKLVGAVREDLSCDGAEEDVSGELAHETAASRAET